MNDRIKELAEQAGYSKDFLAIGLPNNMEKFAELMIKECIKELEISKKGDPYTGDVYDCEYNTCIEEQINVLKEHFGVEETRSQKMKEFGFTRRPRGWTKEEE
jgi:hypothetical protein